MDLGWDKYINNTKNKYMKYNNQPEKYPFANQTPFGGNPYGKTLGQLAQDIRARNQDPLQPRTTTKGEVEVGKLYAEDAARRNRAALGAAMEKFNRLPDEDKNSLMKTKQFFGI
jgi:hypothetical protein